MADQRPVKLSQSSLNHLNKSKKRKNNIVKWKDNERKYLRNSGKAYINRKGALKPEKERPIEARVCKCNNTACPDITLVQKEKLFNDFYDIGYDEQNTYLSQNCMELMDIKRHKIAEDVSRRKCTFKYYVQINGKRVNVCSKFVCSVFSITHNRLQTVHNKMKMGSAMSDNPGKHQNRPHKIKDEVKDSIHTHIKSFPATESHYSRHSNQNLCLSGDLNITEMHKMFNILHPDTKVSRTVYRDIFNSDFKLRFGLPRSDTCTKCDKFFVQLIDAKTEEERLNISVLSEIHHRKSEQAYSTLKEDTERGKIDSSYVVLATDLQQVLFCPTLTHSNVFYQRQYSCYNYAVHNVGNNEATMCYWHESIGKRGSAEIASCLLKYVLDAYQPLEILKERTLVVWSDRCVGQNNNWKMLTLFQYLVNLKYFTRIHQKFLVSGHSFLPCDRDFALIEKAKKTAKVYTPFQWIEVIVHSRVNNPFTVLAMELEDFKDFSTLEASLKRNPELKITEHAWFQFSADDPTSVRARKCHNVLEPWQSYSLTKKQRGAQNRNQRSLVVQPDTLPVLYKEPIPIKSEKKKDLIHMCEFISQEYRVFYENLTTY